MRNLSETDPSSPKRVLVMVGIAYAHGRRILEGIADYVDQHARWQCQLETDVNPEVLAAAHPDGMIVETREPVMQEAVRRRRLPIISVTGLPDPKGMPTVIVDNRATGRLGADHLADLGLKHLAFVCQGDAYFSKLRLEGFVERCESRHLEYTVHKGPHALREEDLVPWLKSLPDPVGILTTSDRISLTVARACKRVGRRIPESVALIGVDNEIEICRLADPPLSSIDHGPRRIGYEAARLLDAWMNTQIRPAQLHMIQPIGAISRQSTDLLAIEDPDVVAALRFVRNNMDKPIKVQDVLRHVAVSRRTLEMHFQRSIGRTIHDEITRVRIDRARHLLINSDWSMPHIAHACGFAFASQFSNAFKRQTGTPPLKFRQQFRDRKTP